MSSTCPSQSQSNCGTLKVQIITLNFPRLCVFPLKIITHWYSRRRTRLHDSLHPLHKSLVFTGLWSADESELHGPELDHQSIENKVLIWSIHESITVPLYSNGTYLIGQGIKNTFSLLKSITLAHSQKQKRHPRKDETTHWCVFFLIPRSGSTSMQLMLLLPLAEHTAHLQEKSNKDSRAREGKLTSSLQAQCNAFVTEYF